jgi:hypothetical protein
MNVIYKTSIPKLLVTWLTAIALLLSSASVLTFTAPAFAGTTGEVTQSPSYRRTYSVTTPFFTPAASATDVGELAGNASNTCTLLACYVTVTPTTAGQVNYFLTKRSTANTAGTAVTDTGIPQNAADSSAVSVCKHYTANPTTGTLVGNVAGASWYGNVSQIGGPITFPVYLANPLAKAVTLSGTSQVIALNQNGVTTPIGGNISITWLWQEQ